MGLGGSFHTVSGSTPEVMCTGEESTRLVVWADDTPWSDLSSMGTKRASHMTAR